MKRRLLQRFNVCVSWLRRSGLIHDFMEAILFRTLILKMFSSSCGQNCPLEAKFGHKCGELCYNYERCCSFDYLKNKRECFIGVSNMRKLMKGRVQAECFYCFRVFVPRGNTKHEFLKSLLQQKKISLNYHLNKLFQLKYCLWWPECEFVTCMLVTDNTDFFLHLLFTLLLPSCIVSIEQTRCLRRWQNTVFENQKHL